MLTNLNLSIPGESTITKSSSETSAKQDTNDTIPSDIAHGGAQFPSHSNIVGSEKSQSSGCSSREESNLVGTISYVEDDGIVMPSMMESFRALVDQATQITLMAANKI